MPRHTRTSIILRSLVLLSALLSVCAGCAKTCQIPSPPPGFQTNAHRIPHNVSQCPWNEINQQITNPARPPDSFAVNCILLKAMDPDIKPDQKLNLVSGKVDKSLFEQIAILQEQYPFFTFYARDPITRNDKGKYQVEIDIDLLGKLIPFQAELDYDHGRWKLSKNFTCGLIGLVSYDNPKQAQAAQLRCLS